MLCYGSTLYLAGGINAVNHRDVCKIWAAFWPTKVRIPGCPAEFWNRRCYRLRQSFPWSLHHRENRRAPFSRASFCWTNTLIDSTFQRVPPYSRSCFRRSLFVLRSARSRTNWPWLPGSITDILHKRAAVLFFWQIFQYDFSFFSFFFYPSKPLGFVNPTVVTDA